MEFKKLSRDANLLLTGEWRLASVDEVKRNFEGIKKKRVLQEWTIARLLDGWVSGPGYKYELVQGHKTGIGEMLIVKTKKSRPSDGSFDPEVYSGVELSAQGREAALLLSVDDKLTEVVRFVLYLFAEQDKLILKIKKLLGCAC